MFFFVLHIAKYTYALHSHISLPTIRVGMSHNVTYTHTSAYQHIRKLLLILSSVRNTRTHAHTYMRSQPHVYWYHILPKPSKSSLRFLLAVRVHCAQHSSTQHCTRVWACCIQYTCIQSYAYGTIQRFHFSSFLLVLCLADRSHCVEFSACVCACLHF